MIKKFWDEHFKGKTEVSNKDFEKALVKHFKKEADEKEKKESKEDLGYNESDKSRELFAKSVASQVFWPESDKGSDHSSNVTKASIFFACKKPTFGPWATVFETIAANLQDPTTSTQQVNFFYGRADFDSVIKRKLNKPGTYCMRFHDEGGLELCICKMGQDGPIYKREKITRKKFKKVVWRWEESVAKIGGHKKKNHDFNNVGEFLKHMKKNQYIKEAVMFGSAYKTMSDTPISKDQGDREIEIMKSMTT